jgi:hypothetical protein
MPTVAQSKLTQAQRSRIASIAALEHWAREDPAENARRGQAGLVAKFEKQARAEDPDASDAEIARRAQVRYRLHFKRMAADRERARAARKAGGGSG